MKIYVGLNEPIIDTLLTPNAIYCKVFLTKGPVEIGKDHTGFVGSIAHDIVIYKYLENNIIKQKIYYFEYGSCIMENPALLVISTTETEMTAANVALFRKLLIDLETILKSLNDSYLKAVEGNKNENPAFIQVYELQKLAIEQQIKAKTKFLEIAKKLNIQEQ